METGLLQKSTIVPRVLVTPLGKSGPPEEAVWLYVQRRQDL